MHMNLVDPYKNVNALSKMYHHTLRPSRKIATNSQNIHGLMTEDFIFDVQTVDKGNRIR